MENANSFSVSRSASYEEIEVKTEDYGAVLFKMENGIRGALHVSQFSVGRKNRFDIEINGSEASMYWNQEEADRMWLGCKDRYNSSVIKDPLIMDEKSREYAYLAAGHPEGWNDAMKNNVLSFYKFILDKKVSGKEPCDFTTFEEGLYIIKVTEAIIKSAEERRWIKV